MANARNVGAASPRRRSITQVGPKRWGYATVCSKYSGKLFRRRTERENPFEDLARHAQAEYRAGRTKSLRQFAEENNIPFDGDR